MKKKNRIMTLLLAIFLVLSNFQVINACEVTEDSVISYTINDAEKVAVQHIRNIMALDSPDMWKDGVKIEERRALFDSENNIEAYYFKLKNFYGDAAGYVITGATNETFPVIEYSDTGDSFI